MSQDKAVTVTHIDHHRNGISGVGFYVALMRCPEAGEIVVIRFPGAECRTAVLNVPILASDRSPEDRIGFARGNSWRGDRYEGVMLNAIRDDMRRDAEEWKLDDETDADVDRRAGEEFALFMRDYATEGATR